MRTIRYYRDTAEKAARLAKGITPSSTSAMLEALACDYLKLADDLERGEQSKGTSAQGPE